jgi:hypothetical protein
LILSSIHCNQFVTLANVFTLAADSQKSKRIEPIGQVSLFAVRITIVGAIESQASCSISSGKDSQECPMEHENAAKSTSEQTRDQAAQRIAEAHSLLKSLREKLDKHPELEEAIEKLEMALSVLTIKTGAML